MFFKPRVLVLSCGDPLRSVMATSVLRLYSGRRFRILSVSKHPDTAHLRALEGLAMDTRGVRTASLEDVTKKRFSYVIVLCDNERATCPEVPRSSRCLRWDVPEPPSFDVASLRKLREQIRVHVCRFLFHGL